MKSNLIPITRIYDIYPKYTYSNDVKKFMDEIMDIERADVFTKSDMVDILDKIKAEITSIDINGQVDAHTMFIRSGDQVKQMVLDVIDKYKAESEDKE